MVRSIQMAYENSDCSYSSRLDYYRCILHLLTFKIQYFRSMSCDIASILKSRETWEVFTFHLKIYLEFFLYLTK